MITKGDRVMIKPEVLDSGEEAIIYIAVDDPEKGRVCIEAINTGLSIAPQQIIPLYMLDQTFTDYNGEG